MLDDVEIGDDTEIEGEESGSWFSWGNAGGVRTIGPGLLFLGALILLFWNEGFSKRHADAILEATGDAHSVTSTLDPTLDGKPVHVSGMVESAGGTSDPLFGIKSKGVALYRDVQMFQWIEIEETSGRRGNRRTTYSYVQDWSDVWHDSSKFHQPQGHQNPPMPLQSEAFFAPDARIGPYRFDNQDVLWQAAYEYGDTESAGTLGDWPQPLEKLPALSIAKQDEGWFQIEPHEYYRGNQAVEDIEIGDLAVTYYEYPPGYALTMVAAQRGEHLEHWTASNGDQVLLAAGGAHSAGGIGRIAVAQNNSNMHFYRIVGLVGAVLGAAGIAGWLTGFLSMVPVVGRLVQTSAMLAGGLFGLMAGLTTIVVGWLAARPWVAALLLIAIGGTLAYFAFRKRKADQAERKKLRLARVAELARQRAAEAMAAAAAAAQGGSTPALATAGAAAMPPPPPPAAPGAKAPMARSASAAAPRASAPPPPPPAEDPKELPPLEWEPGLISVKPPSVRTRIDTQGGSAEPALAPAVEPPARPSPMASPSPPPARPAAPLPSSAGGLPFETVPTREAALPFDTVPPRQPAAQTLPFETVPTREAPPPFETVPPRAAQSLPFETVPTREAPLPFDTVPPREAVKPAAPASTTPLKRIPVGSKGAYSLNKIVKASAVGEEVVCYELMKDGKPIKRGSQAEIKAALAAALAAG